MSKDNIIKVQCTPESLLQLVTDIVNSGGGSDIVIVNDDVTSPVGDRTLMFQPNTEQRYLEFIQSQTVDQALDSEAFTLEDMERSISVELLHLQEASTERLQKEK